MKRFLNTLFIIFSVTVPIALSGCSKPVPVDTLWEKEFSNAQEIADTYNNIKQQINGNEELDLKNLCHMIWNSGEYIIKCKGKNEDINILPQYITPLSLDNDSLKSFLLRVNAEKFADHYFMLSAMKRGEEFDAARDGLTMTVFFHGRPINNNDYDKLHQVFSSHNEILHQAYLEKMKFPFDFGGINEEFCAIRPLIEKNVAECQQKQEILDLYKHYETIMPGKKAPIVPLKDINGKDYTFAQFKGKVLVIDVWATWCSSCIAKMPKFMELRNEFKANPDVEFITVSIDRNKVIDKWKAYIKKHKMGEMLNLLPYTDEASQFECEYRITGIPRYIIINKEGNIITAYAPSPGPEMKEIIIKALK